MTGSLFILFWRKLWSNGNSVRHKMPNTTGLEFFETANAIGKERTKSHQFIGAESIPEKELEAVKAGLSDGVLNRTPKVDMQVYGPKIQQLAQARQRLCVPFRNRTRSESRGSTRRPGTWLPSSDTRSGNTDR